MYPCSMSCHGNCQEVLHILYCEEVMVPTEKEEKHDQVPISGYELHFTLPEVGQKQYRPRSAAALGGFFFKVQLGAIQLTRL
ncbi:unnamed protein product [Arctia plantaginis]|uniref:Uncharacterized protein n=1 Tax=Arctia plantaginis TaxID=874455 RepID=A0A8S1AXJ7_ARCPL|nr:unnamed protein product [Arctia plantaginis]CAB3257947.1 unnamed protein product [Arctia plantaginis]